jgi:hypothetical protein
MALALTYPKVTVSGDAFVYSGVWTAAVGDAAGTVSLGRAAREAEFYDNMTSGPKQQRVSVSGLGTTTLTVHHQATVTDGRFRIVY